MTNAVRGTLAGKVTLSIVWVISLVFLSVSFSAAQDKDIEGSKDHPLISRYPGLVIKDYDQKEFDEFELPMADGEPGVLGKTQHLEGKVTFIHYKNPKGRSDRKSVV